MGQRQDIPAYLEFKIPWWLDETLHAKPGTTLIGVYGEPLMSVTKTTLHVINLHGPYKVCNRDEKNLSQNERLVLFGKWEKACFAVLHDSTSPGLWIGQPLHLLASVLHSHGPMDAVKATYVQSGPIKHEQSTQNKLNHAIHYWTSFDCHTTWWSQLLKGFSLLITLSTGPKSLPQSSLLIEGITIKVEMGKSWYLMLNQ